MKTAGVNQGIQQYVTHALSIEAYNNEGLVRKGSGAGLKTVSSPREKCMLITNFHLLLNNDILADTFVLRSMCSGADGRVLSYSDLNGFDILKDILIFSFSCTIECPIFKQRKSCLKANETLYIPFHKDTIASVKKVNYSRRKFILHKNVILIEAQGKAGEGTSGSPVIDGKGNFLGIVAGGIKYGKGSRSVFVIPEEDIMSVYKTELNSVMSQKAFLNFIDGYLSFSKRNHSNAIENYQKYIRTFPEDAKVHYHLGNVYHHHGITKGEMKSYHRAMICYNRAIELYPKYTQAIFNKGNVYYDLNQHREAIRYYNEVIKIEPCYIKAYINRGNEYVKLRQLNKALKEYTIAIELDDTYPEAYNNRGNVYMDMKQMENAYKDYRKASKLDPDDPDTLFNMGTYYYHRKKIDITKKYYDRAIRIKPDFIEYYLGRAELFYDTRRYGKAIKDLRKVLSLNDRLAPAYYTRGNCFFMKGQIFNALNDWKMAVSLDDRYRKELSKKIEDLKLQS